MSALTLAPAWVGAAMALAAALLLRLSHVRPRTPLAALPPVLAALALAPLAAAVAWPGALTPVRAALVAALAAALLARERDDTAQSECALKLAWTLGAALALSWAGELMLALAAGSPLPREQGAALALQLDPYAPWTSALALALLAGVVLLGGAPFHFWLADVVQGAPAWLAPLVVAGLQAAGAALLRARLAATHDFPAGAVLAHDTLTLAAGVALAGSAATLVTQRQPERRVGTLASLQGGLLLAGLVAGSAAAAPAHPAPIAAWSVHLALALAGAAAFARFLPSGRGDGGGPGPLVRRHPWSAIAGAYALLSLAGAPGTPGARLWLATARALAVTHHAGLLAALVLAWLAAFAVAASEVRRAFAPAGETPASARGVAWTARAALWASAGALAALLLQRWPGTS